VKLVSTLQWRTEDDRVLIQAITDSDEFYVTCGTVTVDDLLELKRAIEDILLRQHTDSLIAEKGEVK